MTIKECHYTIVENENLTKFLHGVNNALKDGYELYGPLVVRNSPPEYWPYFCQALVKPWKIGEVIDGKVYRVS